MMKLQQPNLQRDESEMTGHHSPHLNWSTANGNQASSARHEAPSNPPTKPRVAFYSHDTMGMGHLRRNMLIASSLAAGPIQADTLLIAGTREAGFFAEQAGLDCVTLPALHKNSAGNYSAKHYDWSLQKTAQLRGRVIASTLLAFQPDVFVVDKLPQGICDELLRVLHILRRRHDTRCVLGLRDILDSADTAIGEWRKANNDQIIADYFDEVWVYGDPQIFDCRSEYQLPTATRQKTRFVGYLDQTARLLNQPTRRSTLDQPLDADFDLCVVGGGQDGFQLAKQFCQATIPQDRKAILLTGPFMPNSEKQQLQELANRNSAVEVIDRLVEGDLYLAKARRVVGMGGYNTVTGILSYSKPAMIVPRVVPRVEQWIRAKRLADLGWVSCCHPDELSPETISAWLHQDDVPCPKHCSADLQGLQNIENVIDSWTPSSARQLVR